MDNILFDANNPLTKFFGCVGDLLILSCFWWICSICILPAVPAAIALYDSVSRGVFGEDGGTYRRFWRTMRNEFKNGVLVMILWGCLVLVPQVLCLQFNLISQTQQWPRTLLYGSVFISISIFVWWIPLISRFNMPITDAFGAAIRIAAANIVQTIVIVGIYAVVFFACLHYLPLLIVAPGTSCAVHQFFAENVLKKYR